MFLLEEEWEELNSNGIHFYLVLDILVLLTFLRIVDQTRIVDHLVGMINNEIVTSLMTQ